MSRRRTAKVCGDRRIPCATLDICLRLLKGADICQVAKNCQTSVEMIEKFYVAHIKNMIDAAALNVQREAANAAFQAQSAREAAGVIRRTPVS